MEDILEEIAEILNARRHSGYLSCTCVFHDDKHPSMLVYPKNYVCLSCGARGKTTELLRYLQTGTFKRSANYQHFPSIWHLLRYKEIDEIVDEAEHALRKFSDNRYYLRNRKISDQYINSLRLGYIQGWYIFPIMDKYKQPYGLVARAGETLQKHYDVRYIIPPKQDAYLYVPSYDLINRNKFVFMVFGIIDAITLHMLDFPVISPTMGHNMSMEELDRIRKKILIIPDGDEKDDTTVRKLLTNLDWRGQTLKISYPDNTKDMNEIAKMKNLQTVKALLEKAMVESGMENLLWD